jgi:uncharacterized tellurite resistance protein B-like protein
MSILKSFFNQLSAKSPPECDLALQVQKLFNTESEEYALKMTAVVGIMSRVILSDLVVEEDEIEYSANILTNDYGLTPDCSRSLVNIALEHTKLHLDRDYYQYNKMVNEFMNQDEKFMLLVLLFKISASDGVVKNIESEELRLVTQGLNLSHQHFISARALVIDYLAALKN